MYAEMRRFPGSGWTSTDCLFPHGSANTRDAMGPGADAFWPDRNFTPRTASLVIADRAADSNFRKTIATSRISFGHRL
jgi:hypothetical protein